MGEHCHDHLRLCRNRRSDRLGAVGHDGLDSAGQVMIRAAEYRRNAHECREQAKRILSLEDKDALEQLARLWEKMADVREQHPELELGLQNHRAGARA
jgi:hypothetical protein